ncbi:hypothetical protein CAPTEDRAFT_212954 [Capitella teleta]|uniref:Uncharacterized protein n=1 Tax=Capitella teleta TaxID=283909 RepID=R7UG79_CAPTE|nr:hypothetical protein CAPTEDRAFT_212954 [Capitella teleta]|eukprot:ELU02808.1 hypothetical protein CAPTEDRAFT_212954 [Capitella teleta]
MASHPACASAIVEVQKKHLRKVFCFGSDDELIQLIGDDVVAPKIRTFEDHFEQHLQVVSSQLCNGPPSEFLRMINRMTSPDMGDIDYHSANILMKSLANERILVKFWGIWGQEHIFSKIFMHLRSSSGGTDSPRASSGGSNLPLKEGLMGIIRALKTQEVTEVTGSAPLHVAQECSCPVCKGSLGGRQSEALSLIEADLARTHAAHARMHVIVIRKALYSVVNEA